MLHVGVDLLALQSPHSGGRGIGRYVAEWLEALAGRDPDLRFTYYRHAGLFDERLPHPEGVTVRPMPDGRTPAEAVDRLVGLNPDGLDALLIPSPFEVGLGYAPPARALRGPALLAVVYDLVPFLFQERYLTWPPSAMEFYRNLGRLGRYDGLLAISEATRQDTLRLTGLAPERVTNIQGASDPRRFFPAAPGVGPRHQQPELAALGIDRPYVLSVASADQRKNLKGLLDAFALLPEATRTGHQLVIACRLSDADATRIHRMAEERGIRPSLLLTGEVTDTQLRGLYQGCATFAFTSTYEGFGLPLLEAMHCGAPVLAGTNSSQPEVVGDAGVLVNVENPPEVARELDSLLTRTEWAENLRRRGLERAREFRWESVADRTLQAIRHACGSTTDDRLAEPEGAARPTILRGPHPPISRPVRSTRGPLRVGIDLLALQSPGSRTRGIGRYVRSLVDALEHRLGIELIHYEHASLPSAAVGLADPDRTRRVPSDGPGDGAGMSRYFRRIARENPDALDVLLFPSPFELVPGYEPPSRSGASLPLAAVVHDLIPFLHQDRYLTDPEIAGWFHDRLRTICGYDRLLTNSDWTRDECLRHLGLPSERVASIGGAGDPIQFFPTTTEAEAQASRATARTLGIDRPFVLTVGSTDERKNLAGLLEAFAALPESLRSTHQLAVACGLGAPDRASLGERARELGIAAQVVLTGAVTDAQLRALYQTCTVFAFPSHEEGLGLPLLEAMQCGAPVLAGRNTSQPVVVGAAGRLVDSRDTAAITAVLAELLTDLPLRQSLRSAGLVRAADFTWQDVAARTVESLRTAAGEANRRSQSASRGPDRPRVAMFSPLPPKRSGIATYTATLAEHLQPHCQLDLFHDAGYVPHLAHAPGLGRFDHRMYRRRAERVGYDAVVHQIGNSEYHGFGLETLLDGGGVVVLHDYNLPGLFVSEALRHRELEIVNRELRHGHPDRVAELAPHLSAWAREPGGLGDALASRGISLNRRVLEAASRIVVHSPWTARLIECDSPQVADRVRIIPLGCRPVPPDGQRRLAMRQRLGIAPDALLVGVLGFLHESKRSTEIVEAFGRVADRLPDALLLFAGEDLGGGAAPARASQLGLGARVKFLGRYPGDLAEVAATLDVGISLRRPPSNGETSAALLDLLRCGVPTITSAVGTFSDYPDNIVARIQDDRDGPVGLDTALLDLAGAPEHRRALGRRAFAYIQRFHAWDRVAEQYLTVIEAEAGSMPVALGLSRALSRPPR